MKITTYAELETAVNDVLIADSKRAALEAIVNKKSAEIRTKAISDLAEYDEQAALLRNEIQKYYDLHPELVPPDSKTVKLRAGLIGYKSGNPKLAFRDGFDEETAIQRAKDNELAELVKPGEESIDKNLVKRMYDEGDIDDKMLRKLGFEINQDDSFFINPLKVDTKKKK